MIEGRWMPQTEQEWQLLEDLHVVTRHANQQGVSKARIASLLAFMASAGYQGMVFHDRAEDRAESLREQTERQAMDHVEGRPPQCPECGEPIREFRTGMGLEPLEAKPCGHDLSDHPDGEDLYAEVMENNDS